MNEKIMGLMRCKECLRTGTSQQQQKLMFREVCWLVALMDGSDKSTQHISQFAVGGLVCWVVGVLAVRSVGANDVSAVQRTPTKNRQGHCELRDWLATGLVSALISRPPCTTLACCSHAACSKPHPAGLRAVLPEARQQCDFRFAVYLWCSLQSNVESQVFELN